jgi:hypothetical protein
MLCAGKLIRSSGFLPDVLQAVCVCALRWQEEFLSSDFLANALQASRKALQAFKYILCAGKLILPSGFLPVILQAI